MADPVKTDKRAMIMVSLVGLDDGQVIRLKAEFERLTSSFPGTMVEARLSAASPVTGKA
jgi:hypothetical protein